MLEVRGRRPKKQSNMFVSRETRSVVASSLLSRDPGIRCREVSSDGGATFKRFFHIDAMKTGRADDGSEDFRQHAESVCASRP